MQRQQDGQFDYSDYAYFYDALAGYGAYFYDNNGDLVNPNQYIISDDSFRRMSHELRVTSPADRPVRLVAGLFYQRQQPLDRAELHHRQYRRRDHRAGHRQQHLADPAAPRRPRLCDLRRARLGHHRRS